MGAFVARATRKGKGRDGRASKSPGARSGAWVWTCRPDQICRSTISFLISAIALAGFRPLGQVLVQFMIVWQR